jgi:hypothetical protein
MPSVTVTVPAGLAAGDTVAFESNGRMLEAVVPDGLAEGDVFEVEALDVMDQFTAWFERSSVGDCIDQFIRDNAEKLGDLHSVDGEQSHEWWPMYQTYQRQFDELLATFLAEAGCSQEEFMAAAERAEGISDICAQCR